MGTACTPADMAAEATTDCVSGLAPLPAPSRRRSGSGRRGGRPRTSHPQCSCSQVRRSTSSRDSRSTGITARILLAITRTSSSAAAAGSRSFPPVHPPRWSRLRCSHRRPTARGSRPSRWHAKNASIGAVRPARCPPRARLPRSRPPRLRRPRATHLTSPRSSLPSFGVRDRAAVTPSLADPGIPQERRVPCRRSPGAVCSAGRGCIPPSSTERRFPTHLSAPARLRRRAPPLGARPR